MPDVIRIRTTLTSDTPHLPELLPLVGRAVEIVVTEAAPAAGPSSDDRPPTSEELAVREAAMAALRGSPDYDWDAWRRGRERELKFAEDAQREYDRRRAEEDRA